MRKGFATGVLTFLLVVGAAPAAASGPGAHAAEIGAAPPAQQLQLVLPLAADYAGLKQFALAVTNPASPMYAQYESVAQLAQRFGATAATRLRVVQFLTSAGASDVKVDATGLFVEAKMSVGTAERLFSSPLARFSSAATGRFVAPTGTVSLPSQLQGLVTGVVGLDTEPLFTAPTLRFAHASNRATRAHTAAADPPPSGYLTPTGTPAGCAAGIGARGFTPSQYLTAYDYDPLHGAGLLGQGERVALIEIDGFKYSDILTFARCFGSPVPALNGFGVGVPRPLPPGGESTLDLEVLDAAAPGLKAIDVYESNASAANSLRALTAPLQNTGYKPQVISASLGLCEQHVVDAVGTAGINAAEGALETAAASGITFLASSGDSGSADCTGQNGTPIAQLAVNYPASSWWVVGVGGTNFTLDASNHITSQLVWNDASALPGAAGGGGFSAGFGRPPYQTGTVQRDRRAVPDVAMLADIAPGYAIYCSVSPDCVNSQSPSPWTRVGGTSAATPLLAGGIALIDQALRVHRLQDLGLVNPLLYNSGRSSTLSSQVFSDVTRYSNDVGPYIGAGPLGCCDATVGFDEASGWGSVFLANLERVALLTQPKIVDVDLSLPPNRHPVAAHKIYATVSCTGRCLMGALALIRIDHGPLREFDSNAYLLKSKGQKTIPIPIGSQEIDRIRTALSKGRSVTATVYGVIIDPAGNIEKQTRGQKLTITS